METAGLWTVLAGIKDVSTLVLILVIMGGGYLHLQMIRENRQDRQALIDLLQKNTEALNGIRNVLSAMTGKVIQ